MDPEVLSELCILFSTGFDATSLCTVVLSGDGQLLELLRHKEWVPLGTRIRMRFSTQPLTRGTFEAIEPRVLEGWQGCTQDTRTDGHVGRPLERQLPVAEDHGRRGAPPGMAHEVEQLDVKFYLEVFQPKRPHTHTTSKKKARV